MVAPAVAFSLIVEQTLHFFAAASLVILGAGIGFASALFFRDATAVPPDAER